LFQLALARMREFYREPEAVFWVFGFPIVLAFALGLAFRNTGPGKLQVGVAAGPPHGERRTATCFAVTDNLIKGGAGQAIQNLNLMLGLDEKASLEDYGSWP